MATAMNPKGNLEVSVDRFEVGRDPTVSIFHITLRNGQGIWEEGFGSQELMRAFVKGVQAASAMYGHAASSFRELDIPREGIRVELPIPD